MSLSGGKSKTKSSQTSTSTLTDWSRNQWENQTRGILDASNAYTSQPYQRYTGQMTAGMSPSQQQARTVAQDNVGNWGGVLDEAEGAAREGLNFDAADVSRYYNPFEKDVVGSMEVLYDDQLARQLNEQNDAVAQRGAFGNVSRDLGEAELRRGALKDRAAGIADLKYRGYRDAVDTGFRQQQGQYQGAGVLGSMAGQRQTMGQNDVAMLERLGATEREIEQARLDADRAEFDREAADRLQRFMIDLQTRQGILSSTPLLTTNTGSGTGSTSGFQFGMNFTPQTGTGSG